MIVDYIFDWARDFQREAILNELRILAGRNTKSVADDSDIRSMQDRVLRYVGTGLDQPLTENQIDPEGSGPDPEDPYQWLDSDQCAFRSACKTHYKVSALYITKDNFNELLLLLGFGDPALLYVHDVLNHMLRNMWLVSPEALEELEFMWTGKQREDPDLCMAGRSFYAVFTVSAYFLPDWQHVVELMYIAIADDVLEILTEIISRFPGSDLVRWQDHLNSFPRIRQEHLVGYMRFFRQGLPRTNLLAAIRRCSLSSRRAAGRQSSDSYFIRAERCFEGETRYYLDVAMVPDTVAKSRQLVSAICDKCKNREGQKESQEPFLRMSSTYETTPSDDLDVPSIWGFDESSLRDDSTCIVLAKDTAFEEAQRTTPSLCVYVLDNPKLSALPLARIRPELVYQISETSTKEHTCLAQWNIELDAKLETSTLLAPLSKIQGEAPGLIISPKRNNTFDLTVRDSIPMTSRCLRSRAETQSRRYATLPVPLNSYGHTSERPGDLVAWKHQADLLTCLYVYTHVAGRAGLRFETKKSKISQWRGEARQVLWAEKYWALFVGADALRHSKLNGIKRAEPHDEFPIGGELIVGATVHEPMAIFMKASQSEVELTISVESSSAPNCVETRKLPISDQLNVSVRGIGEQASDSEPYKRLYHASNRGRGYEALSGRGKNIPTDEEFATFLAAGCFVPSGNEVQISLKRRRLEERLDGSDTVAEALTSESSDSPLE